jgi:hypothetical protein
MPLCSILLENFHLEVVRGKYNVWQKAMILRNDGVRWTRAWRLHQYAYANKPISAFLVSSYSSMWVGIWCPQCGWQNRAKMTFTIQKVPMIEWHEVNVSWLFKGHIISQVQTTNNCPSQGNNRKKAEPCNWTTFSTLMDELHSQGDGTKTTLSFSRDKQRSFVSFCKPPGFSKNFHLIFSLKWLFILANWENQRGKNFYFYSLSLAQADFNSSSFASVSWVHHSWKKDNLLCVLSWELNHGLALARQAPYHFTNFLMSSTTWSTFKIHLSSVHLF